MVEGLRQPQTEIVMRVVGKLLISDLTSGPFVDVLFGLRVGTKFPPLHGLNLATHLPPM